ncbi:DUF4265 domain-containing protein [Cellulomonas xiejunii]|uniref:DUF4265 domain-containing protein n=1 Tax=Cellulomonas xiejunii TaxID=2968083 RepID=A0ABY5KMD4_9CELL|nr:DUF4265 domain-containing protein [Cellulomonas xiejunii]MCC2320797.1 DUF4265 domain-containing protein [Cellulomonas xiejunii]UUI71083.1 DUF4265 domain-containing protein [Cellulomonas xiejunii]
MGLTTLRVFAAENTSGGRVDEDVLVEDLGGGRWRLVASPGLVLGVAAGDVIELDAERRVRPVSRGGNVAIHVFAPPEHADELTASMNALGGVLDGRSPGLTVFTVPASAGFPAIEHVLRRLVEAHPSAEWFYGNVYADDGVTPLRWWES